jgi:hypothetical protein
MVVGHQVSLVIGAVFEKESNLVTDSTGSA